MDQELFEKYFLDANRWARKANRLRRAGLALSAPTYSAVSDLLSLQVAGMTHVDGNPVSEALMQMDALSGARALLFGLTLENAVKARLIRDQKVTFESGKVVGLPRGHNILKMVEQVGYQPSSESEVDWLRSLSFQTISLSKYPIAVNLGSQLQFTGRAVGATPKDTENTDRVAKAVFLYSDLISTYERGY